MRVHELLSKAKAGGDGISKADTVSYSRYLGLDPVGDVDLFWLAEEALTAPLLEDWSEHTDSQNRIYFFNSVTGQSSWSHPLENEYRNQIKLLKSAREGKFTEVELGRLEAEIHEADKKLRTEMRLWSEHTDADNGRPFFYNKFTKRSSWSDPRVAMVHILGLKGKVHRLVIEYMKSAKLQHNLTSQVTESSFPARPVQLVHVEDPEFQGDVIEENQKQRQHRKHKKKHFLHPRDQSDTVPSEALEVFDGQLSYEPNGPEKDVDFAQGNHTRRSYLTVKLKPIDSSSQKDVKN